MPSTETSDSLEPNLRFIENSSLLLNQKPPHQSAARVLAHVGGAEKGQVPDRTGTLVGELPASASYKERTGEHHSQGVAPSPTVGQ